MALSPISKIFAVQDMEISQVLADYATGAAPAAPSTPSAPVITGGGGAASWSYKIILSNGTDSAASAAGSTATGPATLALLAAAPNTMTFTAIPAGQVGRVYRSAVPDGSQIGIIGTVAAGTTSFSDNGTVVPLADYAANPDGVGVLLNPKIKLPGAQDIEISGTVKTGMLRGDFTLLDAFSVLQDLKVKFDFAKANIEAYAVMSGGVTAYAGAAPNRTAKWTLKGTSANDTVNRFHYFQLEAQSVGADSIAGDAHFVLTKCILTDFPVLGMAEEDYEKFSATAISIPRIADNQWVQLILNETSTAIGIGR